MKKVEETLKGPALNLKNKNPMLRINTAKNLGKLPAFPEARETVSEALVEAMLDPVPEARNAASEALAKIDPAIHPHVLTLILGLGGDNSPEKGSARKELEKLGKEARFALPVLITCYRQPVPGVPADQNKPMWLDSLARIAPNDKRVVQIILYEVTKTPDRPGLHFSRQKAMGLLDTVDADKKDKVKALLAVVDYRGNEGQSVNLAVVAIDAIEKIGLPEAAEAVSALKNLKFSSPDADVRQAATKALAKFEKSN